MMEGPTVFFARFEWIGISFIYTQECWRRLYDWNMLQHRFILEKKIWRRRADRQVILFSSILWTFEKNIRRRRTDGEDILLSSICKQGGVMWGNSYTHTPLIAEAGPGGEQLGQISSSVPSASKSWEEPCGATVTHKPLRDSS